MLRLSTKGRYATRILVYMAAAGSGPIAKSAISLAEGISEDYVEQIMVRLKTGGLVTSRRGAKGGFMLAKPAGDITVAEVIEATEGPVLLAPCLKDADCERISICVTQPLWREATDALNRIFEDTTIAKLSQDAAALRASHSPSYQI
jgi:Rrf2 family protein